VNLQELPSPLWVLGTGTGVGKTHLAALIARAWAERGPVTYRKPFQTGVLGEGDPEADAPRVLGPGITVETGLLLREPLSPMAAAAAEGRTLDLDALAAWTVRPIQPTPPPVGRLLLEPAGGVMVPLAPGRHFLAWATEFRIPAVVVAAGGLGTLNHTLLTCEALMLRGWLLPALFLNPEVDGSHAAAGENARVLRTFLPFPVHVLS
jgi:dethiobiotin synthase